MTEELKQQIKRAAEVLMSLGAKEVYVFGSAAEGRADEHSDIDMAVAGLPPEVFFQAMGEAADVLDRPVDLIDLDDGGLFTEYLKRKGKLHRVA